MLKKIKQNASKNKKALPKWGPKSKPKQEPTEPVNST